jgi:hypothetical protein
VGLEFQVSFLIRTVRHLPFSKVARQDKVPDNPAHSIEAWAARAIQTTPAIQFLPVKPHHFSAIQSPQLRLSASGSVRLAEVATYLQLLQVSADFRTTEKGLDRLSVKAVPRAQRTPIRAVPEAAAAAMGQECSSQEPAAVVATAAQVGLQTVSRVVQVPVLPIHPAQAVAAAVRVATVAQLERLETVV